MKMFTNTKNERIIKGGIPVIHTHRGPGRPIPPHERRGILRVEFDETDWELLKEAFGDEDTARAAAEIITDAPPEIQILAVQLMELIKEAA